jgi:hypothetical protein
MRSIVILNQAGRRESSTTFLKMANGFATNGNLEAVLEHALEAEVVSISANLPNSPSGIVVPDLEREFASGRPSSPTLRPTNGRGENRPLHCSFAFFDRFDGPLTQRPERERASENQAARR